MITESIRQLIENIPYVFVATADQTGQPHIAIGDHMRISGDSILVFENWFCPATLQNITCNSHVSVVAVKKNTGTGYQMIGTVIRSTATAFLDGYDPTIKTPDTPQVLTRFTVRVDTILEFTGGIHSDLPITTERC
ncbi:MAG: pyridoxamine 5'-phosphate oxidase family protein [Geobacteraceae bacterium]|nr:pyridoxamine 5'-phosphate oxidase family protein [Geobacteraceae bacterium]